MDMNATVVALTVLTFAVVVAVAWRAVRIWARMRGARLVTCPETGRTAAVTIDAGRAAIRSLVDTEPEARLAGCSRWPERAHCDEACLPQATSGEDSTVHHYVDRWFAGKQCVLCAKPIREVDFLNHHAALRDSTGHTHAWTDIAPERLPDLLPTMLPVCWDCHIAETFRRLHPELVVDRAEHDLVPHVD